MRCTTTSGRYRCSRELGHKGECEAEDSPVMPRFGPFTDADRARAYLRGALDLSMGHALDGIGLIYDVRRGAEDDVDFRERIWNESRPT